MNKHEAIKKVEQMGEYERFVNELIPKLSVLNILNQLDEPKKPVVPQFVADWIERERKSGGDLEDLFDDIVCEQKHLEWFREEENMNLVARAWLDGYTVEKEKRYTVKIKGELEENLLVYGLGVKKYFFTRFYDSSKKGKHTRKELEEAGFSEVFNSPLFEVEEVEDE